MNTLENMEENLKLSLENAIVSSTFNISIIYKGFEGLIKKYTSGGYKVTIIDLEQGKKQLVYSKYFDSPIDAEKDIVSNLVKEGNTRIEVEICCFKILNYEYIKREADEIFPDAEVRMRDDVISITWKSFQRVIQASMSDYDRIKGYKICIMNLHSESWYGKMPYPLPIIEKNEKDEQEAKNILFQLLKKHVSEWGNNKQ